MMAKVPVTLLRARDLFGLGPALVVATVWGVNQEIQNSSHSVCPSLALYHSSFQMSTYTFLKKLKRGKISLFVDDLILKV